MSEKVTIGLTGNIGTGKSAIMKTAAQRGVLTIDADQVVHALYEDTAVQDKIAAAFGDEIRATTGGINRAALGAIVFRDGEAMKKLENLLHPEVRQQIEAQIERTDAPAVMIEAIKLLEGGLADECDQIWVANCGKLLQLQRLVIARGMDEDEAFARVMNQAPQADKLARADVVVDTTGTLAYTHEQVNAALDKLGLTAEASTPAAAPAVVATPEPKAPPLETPAPEPEEEVEVVVRRARPSDIPSILLLIHRATGGKIKPKRQEILMSLSERGYLIGQAGSDVSAVVGWYADKGFAAVEQMYIHPPEAAMVTGKAVVEEVNKSANNLMCEAIFAFLTEDTPPVVKDVLNATEYSDEESHNWPRVWQQAIQEMQPEGSTYMVRKLWNARVA